MTNRIACAAWGGRIFSGRVSKDGSSFVGNPADVTSDVLRALIDKAEFHGGSFEIAGAGRKWAVSVTEQPKTQPREGELEAITAKSPEPDSARKVLRLFVKAAYTVDTSIDPRGYRWSHVYLDQALQFAKAFMGQEVKGDGSSEALPGFDHAAQRFSGSLPLRELGDVEQPVGVAPNIDERVSMAATNADEVEAVGINFNIDGSKQDQEAAAVAFPHGGASVADADGTPASQPQAQEGGR